eukprot:TRINITY_DN11956_c0_g1_i2.p1 TRINITY_DN11956_c0_g1~~TRINITY_DN11956_c0_g1_i2.p1  ORF type:complete len:487 (-),score=69.27 TRINITY_DN11956_c0_g1_i2:555-2015(-)
MSVRSAWPVVLLGCSLAVLLTGCSENSSATTTTTTTELVTTTTTTTTTTISIRVAKALGSRGYNAVRISVIKDATTADDVLSLSSVADSYADSSDRNHFRVHGSRRTETPQKVPWSYSSQFVKRWTQFHLSTAVVDITPGSGTLLTLEGSDFDIQLNISLPKAGEGSVGMLIGDPCVKQSAWCKYADAFNTKETLQRILNGLSSHDDFNYWMFIGDLLYDQGGWTTADFFSGLSLQTQSKVHGATLGNHDFWIGGEPRQQNEKDSFGNGHMQWYAQDTMSAQKDASKPFDFSADPDASQIVDVSNTFWYYLMGNVAFVGFSNAYTRSQTQQLFSEACAWAAPLNPALFVLVGHWDAPNLGCAADMDTPDVYAQIAALPPCAGLVSKTKWVQGHTHCNNVVRANTGFTVGAFGFEGCGQYGVPILDTRGGRATLYYYPLGQGGKFLPQAEEIMQCLEKEGHSGCTRYAQKWLDESIPATEDEVELTV